MKKLNFSYKMNLSFSSPVTHHSFALRCVPKQTPCQFIGALTCQFNPVTSISLSLDAFNNKVYTGYVEEQHSYFSFAISGVAVTNSEYFLAEALQPIFKYPSPLADANQELSVYFPCCRIPVGDNLQKSLYLMELLFNNFVYVSGSTTTATTASEALRQGSGVCQDYAHILISLCRKVGIPARYIAGFMIGEGVTHAWVEVYVNGKWIGLDPTHNRIVDDLYIKLSEGRDFSDCIIDRGVFMGGATQTQYVEVKVEEESLLSKAEVNPLV